MKWISLTVIIAALGLWGCTGVPTKTEGRFFDIQTNYVTQVLHITNTVPVTNIVTVTETRIVDQTNVVTVQVPKVSIVYETNIVAVTNSVPVYDYKVGTNAVVLADTIKGTAGLIPGVAPFAELIGGVILGAFAIWAKTRSTRKTGAVLAQVIEVGRELMLKTPQGEAAATAWKDWMMKHQAEQGVFEAVLGLVSNKNIVSNEDASKVADSLLQLMKETKG